MPAGSGPNVVRTTGTSITASEVVLAVMPAGAWLTQLGILLSASVNFTPGTSQTNLTLRIRQGNGLTGTLVGIAHVQTTISGSAVETAIDELDTSAFALSGQGQYTLTAQANAAGPGTSNAALFTIETIAPLI